MGVGVGGKGRREGLDGEFPGRGFVGALDERGVDLVHVEVPADLDLDGVLPACGLGMAVMAHPAFAGALRIAVPQQRHAFSDETARLRVLNARGQSVPFSAFASTRWITTSRSRPSSR